MDDNLNDLHNMDNELAARIEAVNVRVDSTNLDLKALGDRTDKHIGDKDNPHNTTKAQVGLGQWRTTVLRLNLKLRQVLLTKWS